MPVFKEVDTDTKKVETPEEVAARNREENEKAEAEKKVVKIKEYPGAKGGRTFGSTIIQLSPKVTFAKPGKRIAGTQDIIFPELLFNLLAQATPHRHESQLFPLFDGILGKLANEKPNRYKYFMDNAVSKELGNLWFYVGKPGEDHNTMFSCHIDTQHRLHGYCHPVVVTHTDNPKEWGMVYGGQYPIDAKTGKPGQFVGSPLGADDKVGAYILLELIKADVPGLYMFHIGEECGCIGSKWAARQMKDEFKEIKRAIAFDRANYDDIILKQMPGRCGSIEFGRQLMMQLNEHMPPYQKFKNDVQGSYTDTASYQEIISECINMSVGYWDQHSVDEHFDLVWVTDILLPAIKKVKWEELKTSRKPGDVDRYVSVYTPSSTYKHGRWSGDNYDDSGYTPKYPNNRWWEKPDKDTILPPVVRKDTSIYKIPVWEPSEGLFPAVSSEAMYRIIQGWCVRHSDVDHFPHNYLGKIPKVIHDLLVENESLKEELADIENTGGVRSVNPLSAYLKILTAWRELIEAYETFIIKPGQEHPLGDKVWQANTNVFNSFARALKDKTEVTLDEVMECERVFKTVFKKMMELKKKPNQLRKALKRAAEIIT